MKASPQMVRFIQTFNINIVVFCLGMSCSAYGATLLDLAEVFNTRVEVISYTLTTRAAGSIAGGIFGGTIYRSLNTQLVITKCVLLGGLGTILIPLLPNILFLHAVLFVLGCVLSLIEIGNHVWLQVIWKERSGPQLQLYNLVFGVGGIIAPFICEPFLSNAVQSTDRPSAASSNAGLSLLVNATASTTATPESFVFNPTLATTPISTTALPELVKSVSRIDIGYAIIGGAFITIMLSLLISYKLDSTDPKPVEDTTATKDELPKKSKYTIVALLAIYMLLGVSDEIALSAYLPAFVVRNENLRFSKSAGAYLSSAFWMSYTASRLIATLLTFKLGPGKLIVFFHTILMIATVGMLAFINTSPAVAWIGTIMVAFGLSPYFGNVTIWGVQYILLTHNYMSVIMVCVCLGAMIPGTLIGPFIDGWPMVMMWSHTILATALTLCGVALLLYGRTPLLRELEQRKADEAKAEKSAKDVLNA